MYTLVVKLPASKCNNGGGLDNLKHILEDLLEIYSISDLEQLTQMRKSVKDKLQ